MPVNLTAPVASSLHPVAGVRIGVAEAGVRKANRKDLTVFLLDEGASVGGVFTRNRFCAAPVQICRERLTAGAAVRAIVQTAYDTATDTVVKFDAIWPAIQSAVSAVVELANSVGMFKKS